MNFVAAYVNPPSPEAIQETTREILARPEFSTARSWEETMVVLIKALGRWLESVGNWAQGHPILRWCLIVVLILVLLALLAHILYMAFGDVVMFRRRGKRQEPDKTSWEAVAGIAQNWKEALDLAERALARADVRKALWISHRVLLGLLDQQRAVQFTGWKTNPAYLRECSPNHPWYSTLEELTQYYDKAIYAHGPVQTAPVGALLERVGEWARSTADED
jgi:hypothetical protein